MDVEEARVIAEMDKNNQHELMDAQQFQVCTSAYIDDLPELKFEVMNPTTGKIETRTNHHRLSRFEIIERIQALPANKRRGRIRKDI